MKILTKASEKPFKLMATMTEDIFVNWCNTDLTEGRAIPFICNQKI